MTKGLDDIKVIEPEKRLGHFNLAVRMKGRLIEHKDLTTMGKELPTPILGGLSDDGDDLQGSNSNKEDSGAQETN